MANIKFNGNRVRLPGSPLVRVLLGLALICGGFLGFLPVLGFWMIPLGLVVLSVDFAPARRWRRKLEVWWGRRRRRKRAERRRKRRGGSGHAE